jgi:hypothetical protein
MEQISFSFNISLFDILPRFKFFFQNIDDFKLGKLLNFHSDSIYALKNQFRVQSQKKKVSKFFFFVFKSFNEVRWCFAKQLLQLCDAHVYACSVRFVDDFRRGLILSAGLMLKLV